MGNKYLNLASKKLQEEYDLEAVEDIILSRNNRLVFYAEIQSNFDEVKLEVVSGELDIIGFPDKDAILLKEFVDHFDFNSKYSQVAGKYEYFENIVQELHKYDVGMDVTLPIVNDKGRFWLRFNSRVTDKKPNMVAVFITDITEHLVEEEDLFLKTHKDALTNLFNKYTLDYHYGLRYKDENFHVLFLDLDNFKIANDVYGHAKGNEYLKEFAKILMAYDDNHNRFYRVGGDEFVGMFFKEAKEVKQMANEILASANDLNDLLHIKGTSVSIGIIKANNRENVIEKADESLYKAKSRGKNQIVYEVER